MNGSLLINDKGKEYHVGDLVFAKVKGHPMWPAKIVNIDSATFKTVVKYKVQFFQSHNFSILNKHDLCHYSNNKLKYTVETVNNKHKTDFKQALIEISNASKIQIKSIKSSPIPSNTSKTPTNLSKKLQIETSTPEPQQTYTKLNLEESMPIFHTTSEVNKPIDKKVASNEEKMYIMETLLEPRWVTEATIQMYFDLLNNKIVSSGTHLLNPVVTMAIKILDDYRTVITPLNLKNKQYLVIPVNDTNEVQNLGGCGTHWSLLLVDMDQKMFYLMDSLEDKNYQHAKKISERLHSFFGCPIQLALIKIKTPQQSNSYDCGIHMLFTLDSIITCIMDDSSPITQSKLGKSLFTPSIANIINKRGQLAIMMHKSQHLGIGKETLKELINYNFKSSFIDSSLKTRYDVLLQKHKDLLSRVGINSYENNNNTYEDNIAKNNDKWSAYKINKRHQYKNKLPTNPSFALMTSNKYGVLCEEESKECRDPVVIRTLATNNKKKRPQNRKQLVIGKTMQLSIYADSQGRDLWKHLDKINSDELKTTGTVLPNAPLLQVVNSALQNTKEDVTVVLDGTNDTFQGNLSSIYKSLEEKLVVLSQSRPVMIATIPTRYDKNLKDPVHGRIDLLNSYIRELTARIGQTHLIDLDALKRFHYTQQGLHLNRRGKTKLAYMVTNILTDINRHTLVKDSNDTSKHQSWQKTLNTSAAREENGNNTCSQNHHDGTPPMSNSSPVQRETSGSPMQRGASDSPVQLETSGSTVQQEASDSPVQRVSKVVPGALTFSETLKQSSASNNDVFGQNKEVGGVWSPAPALNLSTQLNTAIK